MPGLAAAAVNQKRQLLEGEEADAERQQDVPKREVCVEQGVDVLNKEVIVFKIEEESKIC